MKRSQQKALIVLFVKKVFNVPLQKQDNNVIELLCKCGYQTWQSCSWFKFPRHAIFRNIQ